MSSCRFSNPRLNEVIERHLSCFNRIKATDFIIGISFDFVFDVSVSFGRGRWRFGLNEVR